MDLFTKCYDFTRADDIKATGLYPYFRAIEENEGPVVQIEDDIGIVSLALMLSSKFASTHRGPFFFSMDYRWSQGRQPAS